MNAVIIASIITFWSGLILFFAKEQLKVRATNKAVLAEIQRLIAVIRRHEKWWRARIEANDTDHPLIPFSMPVYTSQLGTIGSLDSSIVAHVVEFFGYLSFVNDLQATRVRYMEKERSRDFDAMYLEALQRLLSSLPPQFEIFFLRYGIA